MGSSYNAEPMSASITYKEPKTRIINVAYRTYEQQRKAEK